MIDLDEIAVELGIEPDNPAVEEIARLRAEVARLREVLVSVVECGQTRTCKICRAVIDHALATKPSGG